jgi:glycosyltransferase involved in cell wall biosynthesis
MHTTDRALAGRRVLVIGTFDPTMPRSRQWFRLLDRLGCAVEQRNIAAWDPERASTAARRPLAMLPRVLWALTRLAWHLMTCERPDLVVFLYPGHLDACVLGPIARLRRIPSTLDVFISLYDTVVLDRGLHGKRSPHALATRTLDTIACWSVRRVVVDTPEHAAFFAAFTHRGLDRFSVLWVGADETLYRPAPDPGDAAPILWYLTYIPLHGFDTVAHAAVRLGRSDPGRALRLVGDGQDRAAAEATAKELGLDNVEFVDRIPEDELADEIAGASICLGVFGTSDKAARVVPNKVFQCAAAGKAIVTAETPAIRTAFGDALVTVPAGDADALADALRSLHGEARLQVAARARDVFAERFSDAALARGLERLLGELMRG